MLAILKEMLKLVLWAILVVIVLVSALFGWVVYSPERAWQLTKTYILPEDLSIEWQSIGLKTQRGEGWSWLVDFQLAGLHVQKKSPEIDMVFAKIESDFRLSLKPVAVTVSDLQVIAGQPFRIKVGESKEEPSAEELNPYETIESYAGYLKSASGLISVEKMKVNTDLTMELTSTWLLHLALEKAGPTAKAPVSVETELKGTSLTADFKGQIDGSRLSGDLNVQASRIDIKSKLIFQPLEEAYHLNGSLISKWTREGNGAAIRTSATYKLAVTPRQAQLDIQAGVSDLPGPIVKVEEVNLFFQVPFAPRQAWSPHPAIFKISAPVALFFVDKDMRPPLEQSCACKIPERLMVSSSGKVYLAEYFKDAKNKHNVVESRVSVEGMNNRLFTSNLAGQINVLRENGEWLLQPQLDSTFTIHSFQGVRRFLDANGIMIPAPFDVLDGTIQAVAKGMLSRDSERIKTGIEIKVDLNSERQKVLADANIGLDLNQRLTDMDVHIGALIHRFRVELPPIDPLLGIPSMTPDSRIVVKKPAPAKPQGKGFRSRIFFDVRTADSGAVQLLSKMAEPHVPVTVQVNTSSKSESAGFLRVEPFAISYLRRKVFVERLQLNLSEEEGYPLGGRLRVDQTGYKIYIDISGPSSQPIINLNSDPYLPRNQIISVLLYDRTSEQLVSADSETVGSFEAAMADRAIGLFGLWAFATTPIRSFSYNAVTKVYTATVQLADGLTAGVGTNWEQAAHLEVRKRVSKRWVLTASWSPTETNEQVGTLVLQWEKRF